MTAHPSLRKLVLVALTLNLLAAPLLFGLRESQAQTPEPPQPLYVLRVSVDSEADVTRLTSGGWDVLEARGADYLFVLGDDAAARDLRAAGFTVTVLVLVATQLPNVAVRVTV